MAEVWQPAPDANRSEYGNAAMEVIQRGLRIVGPEEDNESVTCSSTPCAQGYENSGFFLVVDHKDKELHIRRCEEGALCIVKVLTHYHPR